MNISKRCLLGACVGIIILLVGFWFICHQDFGRISYPDGSGATPYAPQIEEFGHLLMYIGAALSVLSTAGWLYAPLFRQTPPPAA